MKKHERQARILERIERSGYLSIGEAARTLAVTTQTIRRDFEELIGTGAIRRHRGGATPNLAGKVANYTTRRTFLGTVKAAIAQRLASLIPSGASLFVEHGTTLEGLGPLLAQTRPARVVTNNLNLAVFLARHGLDRVTVPAGVVRPSDGAVTGEQVVRSLEDYRFDLAIIGASAVDPDGSLMEYEMSDLAIARAAARQSRATIAGIDSTKFRHSAPLRIGPIAMLSALVSDTAPPASVARAMKAAGVALHLAGERR